MKVLATAMIEFLKFILLFSIIHFQFSIAASAAETIICFSTLIAQKPAFCKAGFLDQISMITGRIMGLRLVCL